MADNAQKTHFAKTSNFANELAALQHIHNLGKALPVTIKSVNANQTAITVHFDTIGTTYTLPDVTIPLQIARYYRPPYAVGDKGVVYPASVSIAPSTGTGPQVASFVNLANLSTLLFAPAAHTQNFPAMDNPNAVQHNAPQGTISRDDNKISQVFTHPTNGAQISSGGASYPQKFLAKPDGSTTHTATTNHTSTTGDTHTSTAATHAFTSTTSHTATAPTLSLTGSNSLALNSGAGGISFSAPSISFPLGAIAAAALASGAAATNVGSLGGDLNGALPNPTVVGLTHIANANGLPIYTSNAAAVTGGLSVGRLYVNNTISGTEHVLCVVH